MPICDTPAGLAIGWQKQAEQELTDKKLQGLGKKMVSPNGNMIVGLDIGDFEGSRPSSVRKLTMAASRSWDWALSLPGDSNVV